MGKHSISHGPFIWCDVSESNVLEALTMWWQLVLSVSSVAQSCPSLFDLMDCSTPGFPVQHQLPEVTQTHVHRVGDAIQPSHPLLIFKNKMLVLIFLGGRCSKTSLFTRYPIRHNSKSLPGKKKNRIFYIHLL